jgi:hypothetical protein
MHQANRALENAGDVTGARLGRPWHVCRVGLGQNAPPFSRLSSDSDFARVKRTTAVMWLDE